MDFLDPIRAGFVSRITSGPGFVNPVRSDPIRSDLGFVDAPKIEMQTSKPLGHIATVDGNMQDLFFHSCLSLVAYPVSISLP